MAKKAIASLIALGVVLFAAVAATASSIGASLFGGAVDEHSDVRLVSDLTDASSANDFSGIRFTLPQGTTFAQLTRLSTEFDPTVGGCGGGSPRFSIHLASGKNVFVFLGPSPSFSGCTLGSWQSSGNLIGNNDAGRYDTSQVQAGTQSNTYAGALALLGSQQVTEIDLVVDAGWFFSPKVQTVLVRHVDVNGRTFFAPQGQPRTEPINPARVCKAQLKSLGKKAFEQKWGSNHNLRNAFGKCVKHVAHERR